MTIASEITDLQTNLANAKAAVTAKGGTVGNTGLAGLATEIAGIPSGGGGPIPVYGKIEYHSWTSSAVVQSSDGCTIDNIDEKVFFSYLSSLDDGSGTGSSPTAVSFNYNGNGWVCDYDPETEILPEKMETKTGITVTIDGGSWVHFDIEKQTTVDTNSPLNSWYLSSDADLDIFVNSSGSSSFYINDGLIIPSDAIVSFQCGTSVTSLPGYFMYLIHNLTTVDLSHANNLTTISEFVFAACNITSPIELPSSITSIGTAFLSGNISFNQPIALPQSLTSLGDSFLLNCNQMVSTVNVGSLPASTCQKSPNGYSFCVSSSSAPAYTTGITLTGTTASDWATWLPDRTHSPFRKLIVASQTKSHSIRVAF